MIKMDELTPDSAPLVLVEWSDFTAVDNWNAIEPVQDCQLVSVGWLLEDTPIRIVIARDYDYIEDRFSSFLVLPKRTPEVRKLKIATQKGGGKPPK